MLNWNWDDLRFVAVLAETGTVAEAARKLNVNRTTVQRRIAAFEEQLEYRLFARDGWGLQPLPEAEPILEAARQIGESLTMIERKTSGSIQNISGDLGITTTDSIYLSGVAEVISSFQQDYPSIQAHISVSTRVLDLNRRESEVAIRPSLGPPEHLVGRRICDLTFHAYGSVSYMSRDSFRSIADHVWVGMADVFRGAPSEIWMADHVPKERVALRADSFVAIGEAIRLGHGIGFLPSAYGDQFEDLQRVEDLITEPIVTGLWILTHPDYRQAPRVRAFIDHATARLTSLRHVFDA